MGNVTQPKPEARPLLTRPVGADAAERIARGQCAVATPLNRRDLLRVMPLLIAAAAEAVMEREKIGEEVP